MPKKETTTMLIRSVPTDVWKRVRGVCEKKHLKQAEFLELALVAYEGEDGPQDKSGAESRRAVASLRDIQDDIKAVRNAINLKKEINRIRDEIEVFRDEDVEMNFWVEIDRKEKELDDIIKTVMPKHEIPEDLEERRKMGLPEKYTEDWVDIPSDYVRDMFGTPHPDQMDPKEREEWDKGGKEIRQQLRELEAKMKLKDPSFQPLMPDDDSEMTKEDAEEVAGPTQEFEANIEEIKKDCDEPAPRNEENTEEKKEIKTKRFGRGFEGWGDE